MGGMNKSPDSLGREVQVAGACPAVVVAVNDGRTLLVEEGEEPVLARAVLDSDAVHDELVLLRASVNEVDLDPDGATLVPEPERVEEVLARRTPRN